MLVPARSAPFFLRSVAGACLSVAALVSQAADTRLQPTDIAYEGSFKLEPKSGPAEYATWNYSNGALAFYPVGDPSGAGDGYLGSLFVAGHVYESWVAEVSIPAPVRTRDPSKMPVARLLQPFAKVLGPVPRHAGFIMGMTFLPPLGSQPAGRIHFCASSDYQDVENPAPFLGWFSPNLSNPETTGAWYLANESVWNTGRYIADVPQEWADAHAPGLRLALGRHRNSWGSSEGANLYLAAPWADGNPPAAGSRITTRKQILGYGGPGTNSQMPGFTGSDAYQGLVWLSAGGKSAVVITGVKDVDPAKAYYGYENWKSPDECEPSNTCQGYRGWRCGDGRASLLFLDPTEIVQVIKGFKAAHLVTFYARSDINSFLVHPITPTFLSTGAQAESLCPAFDRTNGRLYVSESYANGAAPVVHVFKVTGSGSPGDVDSTPPAKPENLRQSP